MILGAFGDSFLFGSDLSDICNYQTFEHFYPSKLTYPSLLSDSLSMDYYCTARPAQSNKVIADDLIRAIAYHKNSMIYIINWTWIDRHEYIADNNYADVPVWHQIHPTSDSAQSTFFYKHFYSDLDAKFTNLMYIFSALNLLLENNCKFIMTYMDHLVLDKEYHCPVSIDYLQNKIAPYLFTFNGMNFLDWSRKHNYAISENRHPLEQAHQSAADYLLPTVNHLLHTKYPGGEINETI